MITRNRPSSRWSPHRLWPFPRRLTTKPKSNTFDRIHIERKYEFGRTLTPNEAFKRFCHEFHGIRPGKKKQEKTEEEVYARIEVEEYAKFRCNVILCG
ncbi:SNU66/SART1 family [Trema orientale]|uniref:SNU66/SART1 family n=1 Tax=Trema orientale TaxID=63057 RepID=A0A2P5ERW9_TREOI|nr:SNU66/SART1 family [Trema orientale]